MQKFIITLPDGTQLTSGTTQAPALKTVTLTRSVNTEQELTLGCVCAAMLEAEIIAPMGDWGIQAGQELTLYTCDDSGNMVKEGIFIAEMPERVREHTYRLTAYDRVVKLDKDLTGWVESLNGWPYDLRQFTGMVCDQCGVTLQESEVPNGSYQIRKFSAAGITGRQLMKVIAQIAGRFCRATPEGVLELAWYTPRNVQIKPFCGSVSVYSRDEDLAMFAKNFSAERDVDGDMTIDSPMIDVADDTLGNVVLSVQTDDRLFYYQGGLQVADYTVQPIEKVHLKQTEDDVGTVYPDIETQANTYTISQNDLLIGASFAEQRSVAETLYHQLSKVSYTPCTLTLPTGTGIMPGCILTIVDIHGKVHAMYVMDQKLSGQKDVFSCTGSARRDSVTPVNNASFEALSGKVLTLRKDVDGLVLENAQAGERQAQLSLTVDAIQTRVQQNETQAETAVQRIATLEQSARDIAVQIQSVRDDGVSRVTTSTGYTFSEDGLRICKGGEEMENLLDNTGMYVRRGQDIMLQANNAGVAATDVTVHNFLVAGGHARFESYSETGNDERTACFYV